MDTVLPRTAPGKEGSSGVPKVSLVTVAPVPPMMTTPPETREKAEVNNLLFQGSSAAPDELTQTKPPSAEHPKLVESGNHARFNNVKRHGEYFILN